MRGAVRGEGEVRGEGRGMINHLVALLLEARHLDPDDRLLERRERLLDVALQRGESRGESRDER